jgi:hypothetical protein
MDNVSDAIQAAAHSGGAMAIVAKYELWKNDFASWTGINDWLLHCQLGMVGFLIVAIVSRKSLGSLVPLIAIIVGEGLNEYFDRLTYGSWRWPDTSRDLTFTLIWPLLLFFLTKTGVLRRD